MIEIVVADGCPRCVDQKAIMKNFSDEEYRMIDANTDSFATYKYAGMIDAVPFLVITDDEGRLRYARKGVLPEKEIRRISSTKGPEPFNLRKARSASP